jgi:hypothetical protein
VGRVADDVVRGGVLERKRENLVTDPFFISVYHEYCDRVGRTLAILEQTYVRPMYIFTRNGIFSHPARRDMTRRETRRRTRKFTFVLCRRAGREKIIFRVNRPLIKD